jgi:hypothetical protein
MGRSDLFELYIFFETDPVDNIGRNDFWEEHYDE